MKVQWTEVALRDQRLLLDWYAEFSLTSSDRMLDRIIGHTRLLARFPRMGRPVDGDNRFHLPIPGTPLILVYRVDQAVSIVRLLHNAQNWPGRF